MTKYVSDIGSGDRSGVSEFNSWTFAEMVAAMWNLGKPQMNERATARALTTEECLEMEEYRARVGAVGRCASVCKCGHIYYSPNTPGCVENCVFTHEGPCIECFSGTTKSNT